MWKRRFNMWNYSLRINKSGAFISLVGAVASVASLFLCREVDWKWPILFLPAIALTFIIWQMIFRSSPTRHIFRLEDKRGIRDYMFRWIKNGGRTAIWTRDMSWVDDDEMRQLLRDKARSGELIICLPRATDFTESLGQEGAKVIAYQIWDSPQGRFTIANYNRDNARVAVGRGVDQFHIIEEFSRSDDNSTFDLTHDLVRLVQAFSLRG